MTTLYLNNCWEVHCCGETEEVHQKMRDLARGFVLYEDLVPTPCLTDRLLAVVLMHLSDDPECEVVRIEPTGPPEDDEDVIFMNVTENRRVTCFRPNEPTKPLDTLMTALAIQHDDQGFMFIARPETVEKVLKEQGWTKQI